ncbi:MAG: hypothetical protein JW995_16295 [Melioribacteraceae bacterium]|nr:hypothetical protein [Melioribacteraceae bacterium]
MTELNEELGLIVQSLKVDTIAVIPIYSESDSDMNQIPEGFASGMTIQNWNDNTESE